MTSLSLPGRRSGLCSTYLRWSCICASWDLGSTRRITHTLSNRVVLYLFHSVGTQADGSLSDTAEAAAGCHCDGTDPRTHKRCLVAVSPSVHSVGLTNISASFSSLPGWGNLLGESVREFIDMRQHPPQAPSSLNGSPTLWSHNTRQALVRTDNCTTTMYINRQTLSCHTVEAGIEPGYWPLEQLLSLRSLHMPGLEKCRTDPGVVP